MATTYSHNYGLVNRAMDQAFLNIYSEPTYDPAKQSAYDLFFPDNAVIVQPKKLSVFKKFINLFTASKNK